MFEDKDKKPLLISRRRLLWLGAGLAAQFSLQVPVAFAAEVKSKRTPAHKPKPPRLLMLDPGHGGRDPGAVGINGLLEKDITLDVTARLASALNGQKGVLVKRTRETDEFLPLKDRVTMARDARADLFISIHADSAPTKQARGLSAYSLSAKASDAFARDLADRENSVDEVGGVDLKDTSPDVAAILMDLTARHTKNAALKAKSSIVQGVGQHWKLLENPMRSANFAVLRAPDVPSLLIETGFLSNPRDEKLLSNPSERKRIASLLAKELVRLLSSPPFA